MFYDSLFFNLRVWFHEICCHFLKIGFQTHPFLTRDIIANEKSNQTWHQITTKINPPPPNRKLAAVLDNAATIFLFSCDFRCVCIYVARCRFRETRERERVSAISSNSSTEVMVLLCRQFIRIYMIWNTVVIVLVSILVSDPTVYWTCSPFHTKHKEQLEDLENN